MAKSRIRWFVWFSFLSAALLSAHAFDFPPLTDEDKAFKEVPGQPGAPAAILYREEVDDDRTLHQHVTYMRIKILTEAGRKYADVSIPFEKNWSNIVGVSGRTVHADGTVVPFDGKVLDKTIEKHKDVKEHVKSFSLPDVQVGSIIEYRYSFSYKEDIAVPPQWIIQTDLWEEQAYFKFMPFEHDLDLGHNRIGHDVAWTAFGPSNMQTKRTELPNGKSYIDLTATKVPPFVEEPYMVTSSQFKYNVRFYYVTARNPEEFWKQEGKYWSKDAEKFMDKKDGVADQVRQLVSETDTPEAKVRKIYDFVTSLENQTYSRQKSVQEMLALGMKDRGVSDILKQKSGDRDDITRLFVAMVRAAGIPAHLMEVTSRANNYFEPKYLSTSQFDAEIAIVTLNGKDVFLDPGSKYCPYGLLKWQFTSSGGIRQIDGGTAIAQTPPPSYADAITQRLARLTMKDDGSVEGGMKVIYSGQEAVSRRQSAARTDAEGRKKDLEDEVKAWLPAGAEVKLTQEPDWNSGEKDLIAVFHVSTSLAANAGKRVLVPVLLFEINEKPMFPNAQRVNGVYLYYPSREVEQVTLTLPADMEVENLPQNENVKLDYALYKMQWSQQQKNITVLRDVANAGYVFSPNEYAQLKSFYDKVKAGDEQQAVLRVSANASGK